jgi:uncharacterized protein with von Willebrand factor type A (vWA) domain
MIAQDSYLQHFVANLQKPIRKSFYTGLNGLGNMIFEDYETNRKRESVRNL